MNGLVRNTTVKRLSRRFNGYEQLDGNKRSENNYVFEPRRIRSMSFKRNKVTSTTSDFPLRTAEDRAKQRRQIFLNSYKFETAGPDKLQRSLRFRKLNKVASNVKTTVEKFASSFVGSGAFKSCNCRLAIQAYSPTPRTS